MTTGLFNTLLIVLIINLLLLGIDQAWNLVNRYKMQVGLRPDRLTKKYVDMLELQVAMDAQRRAEQKPRSKVVPLWQNNHGGDDGHGHA